MQDKQSIKRLIKLSKDFLNHEATPLNIESLREVLIFHERRYYIDNDPLIADFEYDSLYKQLESLENQYPDLITPDSPTQRVSSDLMTEFNTVRHIIPMLSLENSYNEDDLHSFDKQIRKLAGIPADDKIEYVVEPKFDGGSIAMIYENDLFRRAATRGNGAEGEEITLNMKSLKTVPLKADFSRHNIKLAELRGEALIRKDNFKSINEKRLQEGLSLFANPRNAATGGLRTKDPKETARRGIECFIFQFGHAVDQDGNDVLANLKDHYSSLTLLEELGFKLPKKEKKLCADIGEVIEFCRHWESVRDDYEYEIDGMVIKVNDFEIQKKCGSTAHHPRWAVAHKFKAKQATSKLLNIEFQVGKVGSITPVAKIEPVQLAGVTVSSISLHNEDFITSKDIRIGDVVLVERAGDVIPYIVKSFPELREGNEQPFVFPEFCPVNSEESNPVRLLREGTEAAWRCPDCVCGLQKMQQIIFHVSKDAMDIDGLGRSQIERFLKLGWIRDISDIYRLDYHEISKLEGFGNRSAANLKAGIEKAKKNPIHRFLHSLSIHHLGKKASRLIAERIAHVLDLKHWDLEKFTDIKDIGPVVAENIIEWFAQPGNVELLQRMEELGVNLYQTEDDKAPETAADGVFKGKSILFTGTLNKLGRKEAEELAAAQGATILSAVSKNLNILVVGEKAGSKLAKAQKLGTVEILSEDEFLARVAGDEEE
jgi:DNA ligase (NAD+)